MKNTEKTVACTREEWDALQQELTHLGQQRHRQPRHLRAGARGAQDLLDPVNRVLDALVVALRRRGLGGVEGVSCLGAECRGGHVVPRERMPAAAPTWCPNRSRDIRRTGPQTSHTGIR